MNQNGSGMVPQQIPLFLHEAGVADASGGIPAPAPVLADYAKALTKPSNPKDRAATTRLDLTLFPDTAAIFGALAMTEGDCKYGGFNFRVDGVNVSTYVAACRRHLAKWYNGQECDPKTRVHHLGSAIACLAVLIDGVVKGNITDDRPPPVDVDALLNDMEGNVKHLQTTFPNGPGRFTAKGSVPAGVAAPGPVLAGELDAALGDAK